jgi:two-component system, NarL family, invasion response regulator UvrY
MKLLIVDDHEGMRKLIREMVSHCAREIRECTDGDEAVRSCAGFSPDFVIMDIQMPGVDGVEATRRLVEQNPRLRVIAISHLKHDGIEERARQAGACYFVRKENLLDLVRYLGRCRN